MANTGKRTPTGAAVFRPGVTAVIVEAALLELSESGYGRLSMEAVARRAEVSKSALYRRWSSKQDMVIAILSAIAVPVSEVIDTGSLRGDIRATLNEVAAWLNGPRVSQILPDLSAEAIRDPTFAEAFRAAIDKPRRAHGAAMLQRAIERGELSSDTDLELALDMLAAPIYWRLSVRGESMDAEYLERLAETVLRSLIGTL
ncbi:TetR/AcrR family transcriptional regulator [Streptomyces tsukubensis]|uniref:TetR family transcriptional regulator n=1 Tax=Streptomyces tsukubensis TaxID=83656 RepID=A0A1V4A504_9ACTN|nr:TetR/AcrR family transcriptional regulator [Streptomyces tsukubensis]OON75177.1 TetR family transcriptional regulator [Streptomyces tsukubensis]QFR96076.1 TetR family transcriptional regulator [Streptomyces tsukubensis]